MLISMFIDQCIKYFFFGLKFLYKLRSSYEFLSSNFFSYIFTQKLLLSSDTGHCLQLRYRFKAKRRLFNGATEMLNCHL